MLMCWNEDPQKRPKFTELRAKFDAMLLAEKNEAYIDLHIDSDKPYYRLDTVATTTVNGQHHSPNPSRHSFMPSLGSGKSSEHGSKECSPKPMNASNISLSHKSQGSCCSLQAGLSKPGISVLSPSLSSFGGQSPCHISCEGARRSSDAAERRERDNTERRRPVSALVPHDRERREKQNPYVDEPSRMAAKTLAPSSSTHRGSDGAIEEIEMRSGQHQSAGIEIVITGDGTMP